MSFMDAAWAIDHQLADPHEKLLLILIASYTNTEHQCYPSIARLVRQSGLSESTVRRCKQALVKRGLVTVATRRDGSGRQTSDLLTLHPTGQVRPLEESSEVQQETAGEGVTVTPSPSEGCHGDRGGCQPDRGRVSGRYPGEGIAGDTLISKKEPVIEPLPRATKNASDHPTGNPSHGDEPGRAASIVAAWIEGSTNRRPRAVVGKVRAHVQDMLDDGLSPTQIAAGLAAWDATDYGPGALPSFVDRAKTAKLDADRPWTPPPPPDDIADDPAAYDTWMRAQVAAHKAARA